MTRILIVTPGRQSSRQGNRVTATRWAKRLRELGCRVTITDSYRDQRCDLLIALHARKSAQAVARSASQAPTRPIVLALTGTDLYHDLPASKTAQRSLQLADRVVVLQPAATSLLAAGIRGKTHVIYQSAEQPRKQARPLRSIFEVCVSGHLRSEKDPFRAELASRRLPPKSRIGITHIGGALSPRFAVRAESAMRSNARYRWLGEVPRWRARQILARSRLLVLSSKQEGGANVVSEAVAVGTPILATNIPGNVGLLGEPYAGYFPVGDTSALADLMTRCEQTASFYERLRRDCDRRRWIAEPQRERAAWRSLLRELKLDASIPK